MIHHEKIMVCVYYGPNGERLIRRGGELARLLQCPLYVMSVIPIAADELDLEQEKFMALWQTICDEYGATFITKPNHNRQKASDIIAETSKQYQITQLIIGQSGQTRWQEITQGSFVNELLNRIGETDLHIVAVQRMDQHIVETHERGFPVTVVSKNGQYLIRKGEDDGEVVAEGLFFKELNTDFETGLLRIKTDRGFNYLKISQGKVVDASFFLSQASPPLGLEKDYGQ